MIVAEIKRILRKNGSSEKALILQGFFKTGKGEYGEGDRFIGVKVPEIRKVAKQYKNLGLKENLKLLKSSIHEERLLAVLIFVLQYESGNQKTKKIIYETYLTNTEYINNWDIVDLSAPKIVGDFLKDKPKSPLYKLVKSDLLWQKRIAVVASFCFIKNNDFSHTLKIAEILITDKQDLIHKAVGWMLREVGKRNITAEEEFLKKHCHRMPRTMLRYAIEKFSDEKRQLYLKKRKEDSYGL
ncbi:MAG: DNA alkylation repair protein [Candidatus Omnitrophota bacterium]|nr:MAG: DNA alkylation repair protein [Candidatus Omnitrophota bacterium]